LKPVGCATTVLGRLRTDPEQFVGGCMSPFLFAENLII
jgi:hypothetical protein